MHPLELRRRIPMTELLFDSDRSFRDLKKLAVEIGTRPSGRDGEREAARWIASEFESIGLRTTVEEFDVPTGRVVSKKLEVLEPYREEIGCEVMPLFGSTGPDGVVGDLVYLEVPDEEYLTPDVTGKIILTSRRPKDRKKAWGILSKLKPLAIIIMETYPRILAKNIWGSFIVKERFGEFPAAHITYEDGFKLLEKGAKKVHFVADSENMKGKSQNVIGELAGSDRPEEIVIVGGHYDTILGGPGASDNAGGTALVMELARVFKKKGTKRTMRFITWGSEENCLLGSIDYASKLRKTSEKAKEKDEDQETELEKVKLCVNIDVQGATLGTNSSSIMGPPELIASVKLLSKETGIAFKVMEDPGGSDGASLSAVGVPCVSFSRGTPTDVFMHSMEDEIRWLSPKGLQVQGKFIELFLTRYVADAAGFPFERKITEDQKKKIEEGFKRPMWKLP